MNTFGYYKTLIREVAQIENTRFLSLCEFKKEDTFKTILLRHDIDSNPGTAIRMTRHLARLGIPSSFFLLPSNSYYYIDKGTRERSPQLINIIYSLILTGCEIGLHNNAFEYKSSGPQVIKDEIKWLNSIGAKIKGTVAHNTLASYRAENYEIFKERILFKRKTDIPLGSLSETKLGLTYEGTFTRPRSYLSIEIIEKYISAIIPDIQSEAWMRGYLHENPYHECLIDYQYWLIGDNQWIINNKELFKWKVGIEEVIETISKSPLGTTHIFVIHPDYFQIDPITSTPHIEPTSLQHTIKFIKRLIPQKLKRIIRTKNKPQKINTKLKEIYKRLLTIKLKITPYRERWKRAQGKYFGWAVNQLPIDYLITIRKMGKRFAEFVGPFKLCLDIGSGNGLFGGVTYDEAGYKYLENTDESRVVGIDPLPLEAKQPSWIHDYVMAIGEELPFRPEIFDVTTIATSFDHLLDHKKVLNECARVSNGEIFIWTSCFNKGGPDDYHAERLTRKDTLEFIERSPFHMEKYHVDQRNIHHEIVFIKAVK